MHLISQETGSNFSQVASQSRHLRSIEVRMESLYSQVPNQSIDEFCIPWIFQAVASGKCPFLTVCEPCKFVRDIRLFWSSQCLGVLYTRIVTELFGPVIYYWSSQCLGVLYVCIVADLACVTPRFMVYIVI